MLRGLVSLALVAAAACGSGELDPADYRCRISLPDGSCQSMPSDCPVRLGVRPKKPTCPMGAELIPIEDDHCTSQLFCLD
jgi:hypothetical protein